MTDDELQYQMAQWRHHLHQRPETGFEEAETSDFIAGVLAGLGLEVQRGIGGTGVVASLTAGDGKGAVGLRADMDALLIAENASNRPYVSRTPGKMHGCGHDGHVAMLLGAARLLCERRDFDGTVRFIFQPAEEHGRGAAAMIQDGLFERFPVDAIFGLHNMPGLPAGSIATRSGGIMASEDNFVIHIKGRGTHAARPHMGIDPIVVGAQVVLALQTIVSRNLDPALPAVISCTEFITDGTRNVVPSNVTIKGDTRSYVPEVQALLESRMREISEGLCRTYGAECEFHYTHEFAPTVNSPEYLGLAVAAATKVAGEWMVNDNIEPMMTSEDFAAFLQVVPGNFAFIGNGDTLEKGGIPLHNAAYDFNDDILLTGARYLAEIARLALPVGRTQLSS